ncbi:MAG: molybdopterin-dependent oxidoreductase, partial [Psychrosphaera sp.]|nr:molybdopterin-dependent oxidoreductase [Psychrosphaera sp.]
SVDAHPMTLACECFVDEVAVKIKKDPLELRLQWLSNVVTATKSDSAKPGSGSGHQVKERQTLLKNALHQVRKYSGWDKALGANRGKGISLSYFYGTYVSQVAYVSYRNNKVSIDKIVCVVDCGLVINPNFVKSQIEGSIIWSLSAVINPSIKVAAGRVVQSNFHDYPVARMTDMPEIEIHILQSQKEPNRVGEAAVPDTAPAILNAIFDASGIRLTELPIPAAMRA